MSGKYTNSYMSINGCDSISELNLVIKQPSAGSSTISSCNTYTWQGTTYSASGIYTKTLINAAGCDSVHTLNLTINHANILHSKAYIANANSNSVSVIDLASNAIIKTIAVSNNPQRVLISPDNNKAYISLAGGNVSVINTMSDTIITTIPAGFVSNSEVYPMAINADGSKLYIGVNGLKVYNTSTNTLAASVSMSNPTGMALSPDQSKIYLIYSNSNLLKTISALNYSTISTLAIANDLKSICVSPTGDRIYVTGFDFPDRVTVVNTITNSIVTNIPVGSYPLALELSSDGNRLYVSNSLSNNVSVIRTDLNTVIATLPTGYNPYGLSVNADGTKLYVAVPVTNTPTALGRVKIFNTSTFSIIDSVLVGQNPISFGNFIASFPSITNYTSCGSFTWNGQTYTASGVYNFITSLSAGCDSISKLNLTVNHTVSATSSITACNSYAWNGNTYTSSGLYTNVFSTPGCDSTHTLNLTIHHSNSNSISITACDSYVWNGSTYTSSGTYISTFTNQESCDSVVTLQLTIHLSSSSSSTITASNLYTWPANGVTYTSSGTYTYTYLNSVGCIHTATLHLIITNTTLSSVDAFEDQSVSCYGFNNGSCQTTAFPNGNYTYQLDGGTQSNNIGFFSGLTPGIHSVCATDGINTICDTVFIHEPAALNITFNVDSLVSCHGHDGGLSAIITGGTTLLQGYVTTWKDASNNILNPAPANFNNYISGLDTGVYSVTIEDDHGCFLTQSSTLGSAAPLVVTGNYTNILCHGGSSVISPSASGGSGNSVITINGLALQSSYPAGTYTITAVDERACSASAIITINEPASTNTSSTISTCDTYTWSENGSTYTSSGMYTHSGTNSAGCVDIATLNLTIFNSHHFNSTITSVNTYTWPVNGMTYTTSGTYAASYINQHGCDSNYTLHLTITGIAIASKVMLSGAYDQFTGLMYDSLRTKNLIPLMEPYSNPPYNKPQIGGPGGETTSNAVLSVNGNDAIVDWVFIEIRSAANPSTIVATKRALLQRDGDVVSEDGSSALYFNTIEQGNYYISVKHRNHLGVMTASSFALNYTPTIVDFKSSMPVYTMTSILYNAPRKLVNGVYLLWAGDANNNKNIKFNGLSNDKDMVINAVGAGTPNNILTAYRTEDVNMDGKVKYNNADNDKNFILLQLGVNTPNAVYSQHTVN